MLGATRLGGAFGVGVDVGGGGCPGAIPGFLKSLAQEWPAVRVKAVDLGDASPAAAAEQLLAELTAADGLVEVGYRDGKRIHLALEPAPLSDRPAAEPLSRDDVLVTGGARDHRPGGADPRRAPPADADPRRAHGARGGGRGDDRRTRPARAAADTIDARTRASAEVTPRLVEQDLRRLVRGREVRENLAAAARRALGGASDSCTATRRLAELIDAVYDSHGRIDGVIHGAGIEDRLVRDSNSTRSSALSRPAPRGAHAGAEAALGLAALPVFFSSVSGRFGNRGQADYAAASEILSKLAHSLDGRWPAAGQSTGDRGGRAGWCRRRWSASSRAAASR